MVENKAIIIIMWGSAEDKDIINVERHSRRRKGGRESSRLPEFVPCRRSWRFGIPGRKIKLKAMGCSSSAVLLQ